jgi:hypothetical protein
LENALRLPPYDSLPMLIENLKDMEWELPLPRLSKEEKREQFQKTVEKPRRECEN